MTVDEAIRVIDMLPGDDWIEKDKVIDIVKMINNGYYMDSSTSTAITK